MKKIILIVVLLCLAQIVSARDIMIQDYTFSNHQNDSTRAQNFIFVLYDKGVGELNHSIYNAIYTHFWWLHEYYPEWKVFQQHEDWWLHANNTNESDPDNRISSCGYDEYWADFRNNDTVNYLLQSKIMKYVNNASYPGLNNIMIDGVYTQFRYTACWQIIKRDEEVVTPDGEYVTVQHPATPLYSVGGYVNPIVVHLAKNSSGPNYFNGVYDGRTMMLNGSLEPNTTLYVTYKSNDAKAPDGLNPYYHNQMLELLSYLNETIPSNYSIFINEVEHGNLDYMPYLDGANEEGFVRAYWTTQNDEAHAGDSKDAWIQMVNDVRDNVIKQGKFAGMMGGTYANPTPEYRQRVFEYTFNSFLLIQQPNNSAFQEEIYHTGNSDWYHPEYDYSYGTPEGEYYNMSGYSYLFARNYTNSLVIVNANTINANNVVLDDNYLLIDGTEVSVINVSNRSGVSLFKTQEKDVETILDDKTGFISLDGSIVTLDAVSSEGCNNSKNMSYVAFGIIGIFIIIASAFLILGILNGFDASVFFAGIMGIIMLGILLMIGYFVISYLSQTIC